MFKTRLRVHRVISTVSDHEPRDSRRDHVKITRVTERFDLIQDLPDLGPSVDSRISEFVGMEGQRQCPPELAIISIRLFTLLGLTPSTIQRPSSAPPEET